MDITYKTMKDIPCEKLRELFMAVGWSDGQETPFMLSKFNEPFKNSTLVFSAWENEKLVGCVRVLSDKIFRSVIYDLAVHPTYQKQGIGTELLKQCRTCYPDSEWLVETETAALFYEKTGFKRMEDIFLHIPCKWF